MSRAFDDDAYGVSRLGRVGREVDGKVPLASAVTEPAAVDGLFAALDDHLDRFPHERGPESETVRVR